MIRNAQVLLLSLGTALTASAHESHFAATFSGADPAATGTASLTLSADHSTLSYFIQLNGVDLGGQTATVDDNVIGLHFHNAPAGSPGPVVFGLMGSSVQGGTLNPALTDDSDDLMVNAALGTLSGAWETTDTPALTAMLLDALNGSALYLNVHTEANRGGATRGQIVPIPEPATWALGLLAWAGFRRRCRAH